MSQDELSQSIERGRQIIEKARVLCLGHKIHHWSKDSDGPILDLTAKDLLGVLDFFEATQQDVAKRQRQACIDKIRPYDIEPDEDEFSMRSRLTREAFADWIEETELVK